MQEGCHAIVEVVVEKKMKARGPGQQQGKAKHSNTPAVAYDIEEWKQGLEGASDGEQNDMMIQTAELINRAFTHNGGAEVKWETGSREP